MIKRQKDIDYMFVMYYCVLLIIIGSAYRVLKRGAAFSAASKIYEYNSQIICTASCVHEAACIIRAKLVALRVNGSINIDTSDICS